MPASCALVVHCNGIFVAADMTKRAHIDPVLLSLTVDMLCTAMQCCTCMLCSRQFCLGVIYQAHAYRPSAYSAGKHPYECICQDSCPTDSVHLCSCI
jgi:hypothetical protein